MKKILDKLLSARFMVVILLTLAFCYLSINKEITTEFSTIYVVVINYYFYKNRNIGEVSS